MRSTLCEAVARCHLRRLRGIAAAAPLPAGIVALVVAAAPIALFRLGGAVGAEVAEGIGNAGVAQALVLGPVLAGAVAGAALAVAAPARSALGPQVAAGPSGAAVAVVALTLVPAATGAIVVAPSLVALCAGLGRSLPGGAAAGLAVAVAILAAVPAGAVLAEGALALARKRNRRAAAASVTGLLAWLLVGRALGAAPLGPLALVPSTLGDAAPPSLALAVAGSAGVGLCSAWVVLAGTRAEPRARRRAVARWRRRRLPTPIGASLLLARRSDLRLAAIGAAAFGLAGVALAVTTDTPAPGPYLLGTTTALLGSILFPLVVGGMLVDGRWLWRGAPVARNAIARSFALASTIGAIVPITVVGSIGALVSGVRPDTVGVVTTLAVAGSGVALVAGALLPWRGAGSGDQLTSIAAFAALAVAASLVVGLVAPRLVSLGVPDAVLAVAVGGAALAIGIAALDRRLGAGGP
jgi:hypothetical protein